MSASRSQSFANVANSFKKIPRKYQELITLPYQNNLTFQNEVLIIPGLKCKTLQPQMLA